MQKHRQNACALYIRREIGEKSCVFIKRGCASLADDTSITEEEIKNYRNVAFLYINFKENYRNVAFLYINFKEKSVLSEKPFLFLLFVQKNDIFVS